MTQNIEHVISAQAERRLQMLGLVRGAIGPCIGEIAGQKTLDLGQHEGDDRLALWLARLLFSGSADDEKTANDFITATHFNHASHMCGATAMPLLLSHKAQLTPEAVANLERFILTSLSDWMTDDFNFVGANDNAPVGCAVALCLAGEYFQKPALAEFARARLKQFDRLLDLRGYIHECNSPTYATFSLLGLADMVELCRDEKINSMALRMEQRVWQELLLHFHPIIRHQVGPFSRGYPDDNANQCTDAMMSLYCALGEVSPFNPVAMLFPPAPATFAHNSWLFQWASCAAVAAATYHPPLELASRCLSRSTPFSSLGSNEFLPRAGAPCGDTTVQVYAENNWALSSFGSRLWAGQTTPAHALYLRHAVADDAPVAEYLAATRSLYTRCHVSDKFANMFARDDESIQEEIGLDHAAAFSVQHEGALLLGCVPYVGGDAIRTIKTSVVFPLHHSRPDEVWHGEKQLAGFSASFSDVGWSFVRDGEIYIAIHPLLAKQDDAMLCSQQYSDYGTYGLISCYNMCGFNERAISNRELRALGSGFVIEIASAQTGSFEEFRDRVLQARIEQKQWDTQRDLRYVREGVDLELMYDWEYLNLRRAAVNGRVVTPSEKLETHPPLPLIQ